MEDKVPDYWEDPAEKMSEEVTAEFRKIISEVSPDYDKALAWAIAFDSHYQEARENPEIMDKMSISKLIHFRLFSLEAVLLMILKEVKELKNPSKTEGPTDKGGT